MGYIIEFSRSADSGKNQNFWWTNCITIKNMKYTFHINSKIKSKFNSIGLIESKEDKNSNENNLQRKKGIKIIEKDNMILKNIIDLHEEVIYLSKKISKIDFNLPKNVNHFEKEFEWMNITYSNNTQINVNISMLENSIIEFEKKIDSDCSENDIKNWIYENSWIFGNFIKVNSKEKIKLRDENISRFDFTFNTIFQKSTCILEVKKASRNIKVINFDESHDSWYWSKDVSIGIAQLANYLKSANESPHEGGDIKERKYLYATGILLIGRKNDKLNNDKLDWKFELLNKSLTNIKVLTYDHLLEYLNEYLNNLKSMKDE